jgi:hypothetical protein
LENWIKTERERLEREGIKRERQDYRVQENLRECEERET